MDFEIISTAMRELDEDALLSAMRELMENNGDAAAALEACQKGMEGVGELFEEGEYFVGDLIFAGEIMSGALEIIKPALMAEGAVSGGKVLIATVRDDLHDIGKNIVKSLLEAGGFEVIDMGVDVSPEAVVEKAKAEGIRIIALSGVLTLSLEAMAATVKAFEAAGMRESVRIIVGGAPVNDSSGPATGADAWTQSPQKCVSLCQGWAKELY